MRRFLLLAALVAAVTTSAAAAQLPATARRGPAMELRQYPALAAATPAQRAAAAHLVAVTRAATIRFRDPKAAAAAGFDMRLARHHAKTLPVYYLHAEHRRFSHDGRYLDPSRPESLIYANVPGHALVLVGVMFAMPRGFHGPTPGGAISRWHTHFVCMQGRRRGLAPRLDGRCRAGATKREGSEMMHLWFTRDLRSQFAIHAPEPELLRDRLLPDGFVCSSNGHRGM